MVTVPVEIVERILYYCDAQTLQNARKVDPLWNVIVDYLIEKYPVWKWCCNEEIPQNELIDYLEKYHNPVDPDKWLNIYLNWKSWQDIDSSVDFDIIPTPAEILRITCIAVSGRYIAVGSEDGRVKIFNDRWDLLYMERHLAVRVNCLTFICDEETDHSEANLFLVIAYKCGALIFAQYRDRSSEPLIVRDVKAHSVYKRFICYEKTGGRVTVTQLNGGGRDSRTKLSEITFFRIYSPSEVTCLNIWRGVCTFLVNSEVKTLKYENNVPPVSSVESKAHIKFTLKELSTDLCNCQIYRDDIIIGLSRDCNSMRLRHQFLELFILGTASDYSKKLFNCWEVLHSYITCTFLYGNVFVLGVDTGIVYFYQISSWKSFDVRNYQHREIVGKHPIIGIDVKETKDERKFYVTSNVNVHEIVGFTIPKFV